jgi:hypothetical protein
MAGLVYRMPRPYDCWGLYRKMVVGWIGCVGHVVGIAGWGAGSSVAAGVGGEDGDQVK